MAAKTTASAATALDELPDHGRFDTFCGIETPTATLIGAGAGILFHIAVLLVLLLALHHEYLCLLSVLSIPLYASLLVLRGDRRVKVYALFSSLNKFLLWCYTICCIALIVFIIAVPEFWTQSASFRGPFQSDGESRIHSVWLFVVSLTCALFTLVFNFVILLAYHKLKGTKLPPGPKRQPGLAFKALCLCHTL
ncbi:hypothetical protein AAVH_08096 [Aphelenchoides avenae]|nr:hypothetical protein AAVH_08096 [Aphelenchus avenae]